ncbi:RICIN domain-containing protein [Streptomyces sp. NPDC001292]|uniref:RICIN domain-containing protein n=1 Tax=Streptomyces sp. NPDC001292 TaxID=3364558 RepID=UPI003691DFEB
MAARPAGYLYWLHTDEVNLAIATRTRVRNVYTTEAAFGVEVDGVVYFTVHGLSESGNEAAHLLGDIRTRMANAGPGGTALPWIALGSWNRAPYSPADGTPDTSLSTALNQRFPAQFTVFAPPLPTYPTRPIQDPNYGGTPRTLDYAVTLTGPYAAPTVTGVARINGTQSDHYPVLYQLADLPNPPTPAAQAVPNPPVAAVMRNAATTNVAGPSSSDSHVISDGPINQANLPTQTFSLAPEPEFPGYYRLIHRASGRYLGQESSVRNARMVLWPNEAHDQLWRPVYQGDGTWTLQNLVTEQLLTAVNSGDPLAGRDFDGSAAQRWFLQAPHLAANVEEIALRETPLVVNVTGGYTEEDTPLELRQNNAASSKRFTVIYADRTGEDNCYYLAYGGKYINSTAVHPREPRDGGGITLNAFRPNDDGYLWCTTLDDTVGWFISNHTAPDERLYLTADGAGTQLTISSRGPGLPVDVWEWVPVTQ